MSTGYLSAAWRNELAALWTTATIKAVALKATYVFSTSDDVLADVLVGARLATTTVTGRTVSGAGRCACADLNWPSVPAGPLTQVWIYKDTGVESTSTLIFHADHYIDGAPLNIVTTGAAVILGLSSSPNGLYTI